MAAVASWLAAVSPPTDANVPAVSNETVELVLTLNGREVPSTA